MTRENKTVNIIFAGGSIPPTMAAALCIKNGFETYVYLERGRSYCGIEDVDSFHNIGYDTEKNSSLETEDAFNLTITAIRKLMDEGVSYFNFFTGESRGMKCAAMAANCGLTRDQFHINLLEDGIDSYKKFDANYGGSSIAQAVRTIVFRKTGKRWLASKIADTVTGSIFSDKRKNSKIYRYFKKKSDRYIAGTYLKNVELAESYFDNALKTRNVSYNSPCAIPSFLLSFSAACMDNFSYYLQSPEKIRKIVCETGNETMCRIFEVDGYTPSPSLPHPNYIGKLLSSMIKELDENEFKKYLTLVFGSHEEEVNRVFSRTERAGIPAPEKKLVYVNARIDTSFIRPATDKKYGIGNIETDVLPSYSQLDKKYKSIFLFPCEGDYNILVESIAENITSSDAPEHIKSAAVKKVFGLYTDYVFIGKLLFCMYGEDYDIIIKNHPRTDIGEWAEWADSYKMRWDGGYIDCGKAVDCALASFHKKDSTGRFINLVSGSLSTENFEYIGADITFGGQPTSTYNGLSNETGIMFIMTDTEKPATSASGTQLDYSAVADRYKSDLMKYTDLSGNVHRTLFLNQPNMLKYCSITAEKYNDTETACRYRDLFNSLMNRIYPACTDIDELGQGIKTGIDQHEPVHN